jgi:hypothetical protein
MRPLSLITEEAVTLQGIVALLEEAPATTYEISLTQHLGTDSAQRLCKILQGAGILEHPTVTRIILGVPQQVPQLAWSLTAAYQRGEIDFDPERIAGAI